MNDQFKEIAKQAKLEIFPAPQHGFSVISGTDTHLEKFAELIVRECAQVAGGVDGKLVLMHFGVEE
jgi:hypothetical protein